jgi:hypothetical protein
MFTFNSALSNYLQHNASQAIEGFSTALKLIDTTSNAQMRSDIVRFIVECHLMVGNKEAALEIAKQNPDQEKLFELLTRLYSNDFVGAFDLAKSLLSRTSDSYEVNFLVTKSSYKILAENLAPELDQDEIRNLCFQSNIRV